jgi:hypothetical protein
MDTAGNTECISEPLTFTPYYQREFFKRPSFIVSYMYYPTKLFPSHFSHKFMYNTSQKFYFPLKRVQVKTKVTCISILIFQYLDFNNCFQSTINPISNQQQQFGNYVPEYKKFERTVCQFKSPLLTLPPCFKTYQ